MRDQIDVKDIETVKKMMQKIDKPFILHLWRLAEENNSETFGGYMRTLSLKQNRDFKWEDSDFGDEKPKKVNVRDGEELNPEEVEQLEDDWGFGYDAKELSFFERKYQSLVSNYPVNTSLHEEALRAYCIYKVKAEMATAKGDIKDAKMWIELAQKQGEIAKINLNKLTKSDLSQGLDGFSELARMVEQAVDIIPVLPRFIEKPHDKIDFAILCFINYERKLHGLPEVEHSDVYEFYEDKLKEHVASNPEIEKLAVEVEIDYGTKDEKKKLLTIDIDRVIKEKQAENPNDPFMQHLDKWVEVVSWAR